jgi:hypothetical protein
MNALKLLSDEQLKQLGFLLGDIAELKAVKLNAVPSSKLKVKVLKIKLVSN